MIVAYELSLIAPTQKSMPPRASKENIVRMLDFLETTLTDANFFKSPKMKPTMMRNICNIFTKSPLSEQDIRTLYGIFKALKGVD
jgi:tRNA/rRNA methyltransferase